MAGKTAAELTKDNPELDARMAQMQIQRAKDASDNASFASFLLGRLRDETFEVELVDGLSIVFREPTDNEYIDLLDAQAFGLGVAKKSQSYGTDETPDIDVMVDVIKDAKVALDGINKVMAELSVDPSLDVDFYRHLPSHYKATIIKEIQARRVGKVESARKFRKK